MTRLDKLPVLGDPGYSAFENHYEAYEKDHAKHEADALRYRLTGEVPADYVPDYTAASSPWHTPDEWRALVEAHPASLTEKNGN